MKDGKNTYSLHFKYSQYESGLLPDDLDLTLAEVNALQFKEL